MRYKVKEGMGAWWVVDAEDKNRVVAMCSRHGDAVGIQIAINQYFIWGIGQQEHSDEKVGCGDE